MKLQQVTDNCFAVLNQRNRVRDANSGLINLGGGVVVDTQSDLPHARRMIELFGKVWPGMPKRVVNTHEDGDHVWGNQLFEGVEIIAHRTVRELMPKVADPRETQQLLEGANRFLSRILLRALHPGAFAIARQLQEDFDFDGIRLVLPTTVFEERHVLDLDGTEVHLIYVGPCHQVGDTIVHVPKERVAFMDLQRHSGIAGSDLGDSRAHLSGLPETGRAARELSDWGDAHLSALAGSEKPRLQDVRLHEPVEVAALFDFGLTPRHLKNSAETLMKYEKDNPQTAPLLQAFARTLLNKPAARPAGQPEALPYYKCNMNWIVGDGETIPWPLYTSRLDIEPELAVVYGNPRQPVAGYWIFNDVSARDVQAPEFIGGFCLTKDMDKGNQPGPCIVTPDEVGDPRDLEVIVSVNGKVKYRGSTSDISHKAEDVFAWLGMIAAIRPGSVMGFGTIPDCTGLDHDDFIDPGADIEISVERLGTLRCRFAEPAGRLLPSRWHVRPQMRKCHD
jgi:2-keto-4-pentenoate hydratase/2-oxohepta-3-ene-1,7-dioic acid hydratase in catechol pathway/glyoxylase-like metal-dependent hydrolase (beta-lactamase superfamily II)